MPALTQCWYTRVHVPHGRRHKDADGSVVSECRYCQKAIVSWNKRRWYLADGFNISQLREAASGRYLYVIDLEDDFVLARYPVDPEDGAAEIRARGEELRRKHGLDQPGSTLQLRDSKDDSSVH